jgi:hypothetical protein
MARKILGWLFRTGLSYGTEKVSVTIPPKDEFVMFLASLAAVEVGKIPHFGILAGNPGSDGQRFLVLVFDAKQSPVAVVKAGLSARARQLIEKEASFLAAAPEQLAGLPKLRATFQGPRLRALALDFFRGDSPRPRDLCALPALLGSWIAPNRKTPLREVPDWRRLVSACADNKLFSSIAQRLEDRIVQGAIQHGDFAPWNVRVSPGGVWTVLDWERGELTGIPGWDWFHYILQSGILVARLTTDQLLEAAEHLLASETFKKYSRDAAIAGFERELMLAYLLHCTEVIKPSEGLPQTVELMKALAARWLE